MAQSNGRIMTRKKARKACQGKQLSLVKSFLDVDFHLNDGRVIICDIENTLTWRGERMLDQVVIEKFRQAYEAGYRYVILRTNKMRKLDKAPIEMRALSCYSGDFNKMVAQLEAIGFEAVLLRQPQKVYWPPWAAGKWPRKPWRETFRSDLRAIQSHMASKGRAMAPVKRSDILAIGDKFRFDVLRPLLMGWNVVLVNPMGSDGKGDKIVQIRRIENFTLWRLGLKRP